MSEDYAEYDHENIQLDPIRIRQRYRVTSINNEFDDPNAEVVLRPESIPGGYISLILPAKVAATFHLGQEFTMLLTEVNDLGVKE